MVASFCYLGERGGRGWGCKLVVTTYGKLSGRRSGSCCQFSQPVKLIFRLLWLQCRTGPSISNTEELAIMTSFTNDWSITTDSQILIMVVLRHTKKQAIDFTSQQTLNLHLLIPFQYKRLAHWSRHLYSSTTYAEV